jgi:hypothetical protein
MEALIWLTIVITVLAVALSFVWSGDAASPMGDGMAIGCLLMAVPLWPITMPLWLLYLLKRHADEIALRRR